MMTLKEFGAECEVEYRLQVSVNGEVVFDDNYYSDDSLQGDLRKVDDVIADSIVSLYEDLPEPIEDESRGYNGILENNNINERAVCNE